MSHRIWHAKGGLAACGGESAFFCVAGVLQFRGVGGISHDGLFRDVDGAIYGIIVSYMLAFVVDKVMYGTKAGKMALIVTEQGKRVCKKIDHACQRGTTLVRAQGSYQDVKTDGALRLQQHGDVSGIEDCRACSAPVLSHFPRIKGGPRGRVPDGADQKRALGAGK